MILANQSSAFGEADFRSFHQTVIPENIGIKSLGIISSLQSIVKMSFFRRVRRFFEPSGFSFICTIFL
jgi:hypothetical protein